MRVFITGATGFVGLHLVAALLARGDDVWGLVHPATSRHAVPQTPRFHAIEGDLLDREGLQSALRRAQPEQIFHLAGQAYPAASWRDPALTLAVNTTGVALLLDAAVSVGRPQTVVVTSADIYGAVRPSQLPITERTAPRPRHPYGVSKWAAGQLVRVYAERYGLPAVDARPFNHIGPGQGLGFVVPDFAAQVVAARLGQRPPVLRVGDLTAQRDFTDVRDVVRAYQLLAEHGRPGRAYIICSGRPVAIQTLLDTLLAINSVAMTVETDPDRLRGVDAPVLYGSHARLSADTGWQPTIALETSLRDVTAEWVARLGSPAEPHAA